MKSVFHYFCPYSTRYVCQKLCGRRGNERCFFEVTVGQQDIILGSVLFSFFSCSSSSLPLCFDFTVKLLLCCICGMGSFVKILLLSLRAYSCTSTTLFCLDSLASAQREKRKILDTCTLNCFNSFASGCADDT